MFEKFKRKINSIKQCYVIQGQNNHIIIYDNQNNERNLDLNSEVFQGLSVSIYGNNNTIKIHTPLVCDGSKILIGTPDYPNDDATIEIESTKCFVNNVIYINYGCCQSLFIGKNSMIPNSSMALAENSKIKIGENCLFANGVSIRGADGHTVFDDASGEILNKNASVVTIGKHCWVGRNVSILKRAVIPDNSIVAECSVVTKSFESEMGGGNCFSWDTCNDKEERY